VFLHPLTPLIMELARVIIIKGLHILHRLIIAMELCLLQTPTTLGLPPHIQEAIHIMHIHLICTLMLTIIISMCPSLFMITTITIICMLTIINQHIFSQPQYRSLPICSSYCLLSY
jgi:hypothetical protein